MQPIRSYNFYPFIISRSAAANISVLASPRMIPICIVASVPWDSIQHHLHSHSAQQLALLL